MTQSAIACEIEELVGDIVSSFDFRFDEEVTLIYFPPNCDTLEELKLKLL